MATTKINSELVEVTRTETQQISKADLLRNKTMLVETRLAEIDDMLLLLK